MAKIPEIKKSQSYSLKLIILCALVLAMAIPAMFISNIVYERTSRADEAVKEVSDRYGGAQIVSGPILALPSWTRTPLERFEADIAPHKSGASQYVIFPETGGVKLEQFKTTIRKRGLFKVPTYEGDVAIQAKFSALSDYGFSESRMFNQDKAVIFFALSDPRGLVTDPILTLPNGVKMSLLPARNDTAIACCDIQVIRDKIIETPRPRGLQTQSGLTYLYAPIGPHMADLSKGDLRIDLRISGAKSLSLLPFAKTTRVAMSSDWKHPGFDGHFPPRDYAVNDDGFTASWSVPFLSRGIAAHGTAEELPQINHNQRVMRVNFISALNPYRMLNRALKYSVLFIGMIFLTFYLSELMMSIAIHPAQYGLVGLAQAVFYLLLLAFAEQVGFTLAFIISAAGTIGLTAIYAATSFGNSGYALRFGGIFTGVYGLMFTLLNVQGVALLTSAIVSFGLIALTMYLTRNLDWYDIQDEAAKQLAGVAAERFKETVK